MESFEAWQVREAVEAQVEGTEWPGDPLALSYLPYHLHKQDRRSPVHLTFSVDVLSSEADSERQRSVAFANSDLRVVLCYQYPKHGQRGGRKAVDEFGDILRKRVLSVDGSYPVSFRPVWRSTTVSYGPDGWAWIELSFSAFHYVATV